jgi:pimeloyl-ACP methyl ester carboxylesterase
VSSIEQWWRDGEQFELLLNGSERHCFVRRFRNAAPHMTLLHGFPSSSHDWAKVAPALAEHYELLAPDFLGFGASDKPPDHAYSIAEQADLTEALWEIEGVATTHVVAHDYAVSVLQELLARRAEGTLSTQIEGVHLLNGGLYPDLHRPEPAQTVLLDPEQGPQLSANLNLKQAIRVMRGLVRGSGLFWRGFDAAVEGVRTDRDGDRARVGCGRVSGGRDLTVVRGRWCAGRMAGS